LTQIFIDAIASLTEEQKNIIRRDFLVRHLSDTFGERRQSHLLIEFASLHFPGEVSQIKQKHNEVYKKRHIRIEERIVALQPVAVRQVEDAEVLPVEQFDVSTPIEEIGSSDCKEPVIGEMIDEAITNTVDLQPEHTEYDEAFSADVAVSEYQPTEFVPVSTIVASVPIVPIVPETPDIPETNGMDFQPNHPEYTESFTSDSWEAFVAENSHELDSDALTLQPGQPDRAAIGRIPEEEEKILDKVYEESAA